jgi:hypothetical protein
MLMLSLIWLVGGLVIGWLVWAAALPSPRGAAARWRLWRYAATGAVAALVGGWLGSLLLGELFGSPAALWICVLATAAAPYVSNMIRRSSSQGLVRARPPR